MRTKNTLRILAGVSALPFVLGEGVFEVVRYAPMENELALLAVLIAVTSLTFVAVLLAFGLRQPIFVK